MNQVKEYIEKRVHELYYGIDMNCARTTMTCISELLGIKIEEQTMDAALGMHVAGGFREDDPPHLCEQLTCKSIYFTYCYLHHWMERE